MLDSIVALIRVVVEEEFGQFEASKSNLGPEAGVGTDFKRLRIIFLRFGRPTGRAASLT